MNTACSKPDSVSTVNMTPEEPMSERTIFCTPALSATAACSKSWWTR